METASYFVGNHSNVFAQFSKTNPEIALKSPSIVTIEVFPIESAIAAMPMSF